MIPYGRHHIDKEDLLAVNKVLRSNFLTQGPLVSKFDKQISKYVGSKYAVVVSSCTAGLHLASIISNNVKGKASFLQFHLHLLQILLYLLVEK